MGSFPKTLAQKTPPLLPPHKLKGQVLAIDFFTILFRYLPLLRYNPPHENPAPSKQYQQPKQYQQQLPEVAESID